MKTILVNGLSREQRIAVLDGKELIGIKLLSAEKESLVGNIYAGRIEKIVPGMDAAFVYFGQEKNGFIRKEDLPAYQRANNPAIPINQLATQGEKLLVQVKKDGTEHKGASLSGCVEIASPELVYMPEQHYISLSKKFTPEERKEWKETAEMRCRENEGMLIRTDMKNRDERFFEELLDRSRAFYRDLQASLKGSKPGTLLYSENRLLKMVRELMKQEEGGDLYIDSFPLYEELKGSADNWNIRYYRERENIFSAWQVDASVDKMHNRVVWLDNGAFLVIEEGEAMTTIDVNSGKYTGKQHKGDTLLEVNLMAAEASMKQIKLRNLSGMILIDFINCSSGMEKDKILKRIRSFAQQDSTTTKVIGFTELGILQLTRKRTSASFKEYTTAPCPVCNGTGRVESAESCAFRLEREILGMRNSGRDEAVVEMTKDVLHWFTGENALHKERLECDSGLHLSFRLADSDKPEYRIKEVK